jgi:hypothetical protein
MKINNMSVNIVRPELLAAVPVKVTLGGEEMIHINIKGDIGPSFSIA